jgi:hypothetical protein
MRLPTPAAHGLPDEATIAVPVPDRGLTLYRLLEANEPQLGDFEPDWTRPQAQLRGIPELFRVSISHWLEQAQARRASARSVAFIATIELRDEPLARVAMTEREGLGHVDVWAYPRTLLAAVVAVVRLERPA